MLKPTAAPNHVSLAACAVLRHGRPFWLALCLAWGSITAHAQTPPATVAPTGGIWSSGTGFHFDLKKKKAIQTRQSLSGVACALNATQQRVCLVVFDEGTELRFATVADGALVPDNTPITLPGLRGELDAEAAATDGRYFYATGSHSAKRSNCRSNPDSRHVLRLRRDPQTGGTLRGADGVPVDYAETGRLWDVMQTLPALQAHVGKCLDAAAGQQGVNIEGLSVRDGRLYFGLRGPVNHGVAQVLSVDADALFAGGDVHPTLTPLALGPHRGIRDMVAVRDGFLLLAGPDDDPAWQNLGWTVVWWDGKENPGAQGLRTLAALDLRSVTLRKCDKEIKPEALTVLGETPQTYRLLVLSDGLCDGGPLVFTVPRP